MFFSEYAKNTGMMNRLQSQMFRYVSQIARRSYVECDGFVYKHYKKVDFLKFIGYISNKH